MAGFWAELPPGRVRHLVGASPEAIALALEPLPDDAPAVLTCQITAQPSSPRVVAAVLDQLETAAMDLYPAWLPGAEAIDGPGGAGASAVRALAVAKAATTSHFGPFLAGLAVRSSGGGSANGRLPVEVRAAGLARVIADSFRRASTALLVPVPEGLAPAAGSALVAAGEWLAYHGGFAVWLAGAAPRGAARVPLVPVGLPAHVANLAAAVAADGVDAGAAAAPPATADAEAAAVLRIPAIAGRPHPASQAEQALEAALAGEPWATGRVWNQTFQADPLANPVRVDLMWAAERCAVEIDGAEHRGPLHYEADRRRDVMLQLGGFAVLRFTNAQTLSDIGMVLSQIEQMITIRRLGRDGHAR
jgi:very-short-patch-repair endonuclease